MSKEQFESLCYEEQNLTNKIKILSDQQDELRTQIAEHNSPFKVGDRVITEDGKKAIVAKVTYWVSNKNYSLYIRKIKKDGTPYRDTTRVYHNEALTPDASEQPGTQPEK